MDSEGFYCLLFNLNEKELKRLPYGGKYVIKLWCALLGAPLDLEDKMCVQRQRLFRRNSTKTLWFNKINKAPFKELESSSACES